MALHRSVCPTADALPALQSHLSTGPQLHDNAASESCARVAPLMPALLNMQPLVPPEVVIAADPPHKCAEQR